MNIEDTAKQIMSAKQSDAFDEEACVKILRDAFAALIKERDELAAALRAAQPKPESWQKIAREHWLKLADANTAEEEQDVILAAIERSHAEEDLMYRYHNDPRLHRFVQEFARSFERSHATQPQHSDQPPAKTTDDKQEWTPLHLLDIKLPNGTVISCKCIADRDTAISVHNAELASEHQRRKQAEGKLTDAEAEGEALHSQLLSALAAIERARKRTVDFNVKWPELESVDLSALREHDEKLTAEVRNPLVNALKKIRDEAVTLVDARKLPQSVLHIESPIRIKGIANDALAKAEP